VSSANHAVWPRRSEHRPAPIDGIQRQPAARAGVCDSRDRCQQGRVSEAIPLFEATLAERERVLGSDHPDTLTSRDHLGYAYAQAGRLDEATTLYERVLADSERTLGSDHPTTQAIQRHLSAAQEASSTAATTLTDADRSSAEPDLLTGARVPLAARVVEVIADLGNDQTPRYRYGSGCIVLGRTVLTAAHVVADAQVVQVRRPDRALRPAQIDRRFVGSEAGPDLALIDIDDNTIDLEPIELAVVDRDNRTGGLVERCHVVGYPPRRSRRRRRRGTPSM
jgi:hypothetical protein